MSVEHLDWSWFVAGDRPYVEHWCPSQFVPTNVGIWTPPNPPWSITEEGGVSPSFACTVCGSHTILGPHDRCDTPEGRHRCHDPRRHAAIAKSRNETVASDSRADL